MCINRYSTYTPKILAECHRDHCQGQLAHASGLKRGSNKVHFAQVGLIWTFPNKVYGDSIVNLFCQQDINYYLKGFSEIVTWIRPLWKYFWSGLEGTRTYGFVLVDQTNLFWSIWFKINRTTKDPVSKILYLAHLTQF